MGKQKIEKGDLVLFFDEERKSYIQDLIVIINPNYEDAHGPECILGIIIDTINDVNDIGNRIEWNKTHGYQIIEKNHVKF